MTPKVSVIIPVYNAEPYLRECLDSVVHQTLRDIEILCIDDGSTDGSPAVLAEYAAADSRVSVLVQENAGAGAARNKGLAIAKGEYLSILDADDFFEKDMLEKAYARALDAQADVVIFRVRTFNCSTQEFCDATWACNRRMLQSADCFAPEQMAPYLFNAFQNWTWNKLFSLSFVRREHLTFQEIFRTNDMRFTCLALALAQKIALLDESLANYRIGMQANCQASNHLYPTDFCKAYSETQNELQKRGLYRTYQQSFLNAVAAGFIYNMKSVRTEASFLQVYDAVRRMAEAEFGIFSHPKRYYYSALCYENLKRVYHAKRPQDVYDLFRYAKPNFFKILPRKIRGGIQCCLDHGFSYTVQLAFRKVGRLFRRASS